MLYIHGVKSLVKLICSVNESLVWVVKTGLYAQLFLFWISWFNKTFIGANNKPTIFLYYFGNVYIVWVLCVNDVFSLSHMQNVRRAKSERTSCFFKSHVRMTNYLDTPQAHNTSASLVLGGVWKQPFSNNRHSKWEKIDADNAFSDWYIYKSFG